MQHACVPVTLSYQFENASAPKRSVGLELVEAQEPRLGQHLRRHALHEVLGRRPAQRVAQEPESSWEREVRLEKNNSFVHAMRMGNAAQTASARCA